MCRDRHHGQHLGLPHNGGMWNDQFQWYERSMLWILRQGDVPSHVAIMPDGNRRFSRVTGTELHETYVSGTLLYGRACLWCFGTGVDEITTFLLATRHSRRCEFEKSALLSGVIDTIMESSHYPNRLRSPGVHMRNCGPMELLPKEYQVKLATLEVATTSDTRMMRKQATFYIDGTKSQMLRMARDLSQAVGAGALVQEDITADFIDAYLAVVECFDVDMLMRCAGRRFSDFAVPQCSYAYLNFVPELWEQLGFWGWIWAFVKYQIHWPAIKVKTSFLFSISLEFYTMRR
ncbi:hypothetical protein HPB50_021502 [Hyalomma asiaticum]|uniref:Uncharacterized protein n=1 Tax=Hyalomma asiaticum TaxID=266040 RepID=A0ACB7SHV2_HYAAI|nr:hypothetical protein HPB50_021502 [Hyalomma asiaticum]